MKSLFLFFFFVIASCSIKPRLTTKYNFENDPNLNEIEKSEIRDSNYNKNWKFEKIEELYTNLKLKPFYFLEKLLDRAIAEKKWDKVEFYALEYLNTAKSYQKNWNFGNAIFYGNMALASVSIQKHDNKSAIKHIILASLTPGSPQLNSFGPFNDSLYTEPLFELFKLGERNSLIEFAQNCKKFLKDSSEKETPENHKLHESVSKWNIDSMDRFINQIQTNQTPDFKNY